jgi:tRNA-specific 2-thiouridylase
VRFLSENRALIARSRRVTKRALEKTLFPLGEYTKPEVRELAKTHGLATAAKKESMGVCFVGQVGMRDFLSQYVETNPGDIIEKESGELLGRHDGAIFYTLGQRRGLGLGGGLPYYVVGKSVEDNIVYVSRNLSDDAVWRTSATLEAVHSIDGSPLSGDVQARIRHRAPLVDAHFDGEVIHFADPQRAVTPGQSVVLYSGEMCRGGGIVDS